MLSRWFVVSVAVLLIGCGEDASSGGAPVEAAAIVAEYPHDPQAFTQGLVHGAGQLFEGTGLRGASSLRRVTLETGEVTEQVALDAALFGEGITLWQGRLFQLTWQAGRAFVYDAGSLAVEGERSYPTEGWGLTDDGEGHLVLSDGTATLYLLDPETFEEHGRVEVTDGGEPVERLNELEHIDGAIWANVWQTERIARIDLSTGEVMSWVSLEGLQSQVGKSGNEDVLNGIAVDAETGRIFVTGKRWPTLFEISL